MSGLRINFIKITDKTSNFKRQRIYEMIDDQQENVLSVFSYLQHLQLMFKPADYSHNGGNLCLYLIDAALLCLVVR